MKNKIFSMFVLVLVVTMFASTVSAGGNVGFSGGAKSITWTIGSLTAEDDLVGLGGFNEGVIVTLSATGDPVVTCINQGGNEVPGQNPAPITASGIQEITSVQITKKGTAPLDLTAEPGPITGIEGGCPNNNWFAAIIFVFWTNATITVTDNLTGDELLVQHFTCVTTRNPDNTGTVSCQPVQ